MRIADFVERHPVVCGVVLVDFLIIVVMVVMGINKATRTATVDILTVPSTAKVRIDGGEYGNGAYMVHPGDYEVMVEAEGFATKTVSVSARADEISKIWVYLVPEEGFEWYALRDNYGEFEELAKMVDVSRNITTDQDMVAAEFVEEYKIEVQRVDEVLPINIYEYNNEGSIYTTLKDVSINKSSSSDCRKFLCIEVSVKKIDDENYVEELLREKKLETDLIEVRYETPFIRQ